MQYKEDLDEQDHLKKVVYLSEMSVKSADFLDIYLPNLLKVQAGIKG